MELQRNNDNSSKKSIRHIKSADLFLFAASKRVCDFKTNERACMASTQKLMMIQKLKS